ncbi:MAG: hypothetical protein OIF36_03260 [Alphaproteobacteria bacterium]|jgi:hypothetical protein|nr:hypothetical protein [Alphaproteobacteria bacterium]MCV6599481.1 hypothetical protein [Alphaproteobacteria bacterium]
MKIKFDKDLIKRFSQISSPRREPSINVFNKNTKTLIFVAAKHGENAKTFSLIDKAFKEFKIDKVIIERDKSFKPFIKKILDKKQKCSEFSYAINKCGGRGIVFGEPCFDEQISELIKLGYEKIDIAFYYYLRYLNNFKIEKYKDNFIKRAKAYKDDKFYLYRIKILNLDKDEISFDKFKNWFKSKYKKDLSYDNYKSNMTAPFDRDEISTISGDLTKIRDKKVLDEIEDIFISEDVVLVVYGMSHYDTLEHSIKNSMNLV